MGWRDIVNEKGVTDEAILEGVEWRDGWCGEWGWVIEDEWRTTSRYPMGWQETGLISFIVCGENPAHLNKVVCFWEVAW